MKKIFSITFLFLIFGFTVQAQVKTSTISINFGDYIKSGPTEYNSEVFNETVIFHDLEIDSMKISGFVTVKTKFVYMGYPYIVAEYDDLTITDVVYKNTNYSRGLNPAKKYLNLPYKAKSKPLMNVVCYIWTPKVKNPQHLRKKDYKIFNYPIKKLASITDHYDNDEADKYFESFNPEEEHDSFFWIQSELRHPKQDVMHEFSTIDVTSISLTLKQELEKKLETYLYEKDRDFWGNKIDSTKTKKDDDDFWDN